MQKDPDKMILRSNLFTISANVRNVFIRHGSWKMSYAREVAGMSSREAVKGTCLNWYARDKTRLLSHFR